MSSVEHSIGGGSEGGVGGGGGYRISALITGFSPHVSIPLSISKLVNLEYNSSNDIVVKLV